MKLHSLNISNFGPFRGKHKIRFAGGAGDLGGTVTVIIRAGGLGLTTLLRAMRFVLLGGKPDRDLLNRQEVLARSSQRGEPVEARVELCFTHGQRRFELRRSLESLSTEGGDAEDVIQSQLETREAEGGVTATNDPEEITAVLNAIIEPGLRKPLFFDGDLVRSTAEPYLPIGEHRERELSLIAALVRTTTDAGKELPFVMDSPFAPLDLQHRRDILTELPRWCGQLILLLRKAELTREECKTLLDSGRGGRFYALRGCQDGGSVLEQVSIENGLAMLR